MVYKKITQTRKKLIENKSNNGEIAVAPASPSLSEFMSKSSPKITYRKGNVIIHDNENAKAVEKIMPKPIETIAVKEDLPSIKEPVVDKKEEKLITMEVIEFKRGKDTLSVRLSKKENRMYRVQIILNGKTEVRPVTYLGAASAYSFWNLFKKEFQNA